MTQRKGESARSGECRNDGLAKLAHEGITRAGFTRRNLRVQHGGDEPAHIFYAGGESPTCQFTAELNLMVVDGLVMDSTAGDDYERFPLSKRDSS